MTGNGTFEIAFRRVLLAYSVAIAIAVAVVEHRFSELETLQKSNQFREYVASQTAARDALEAEYARDVADPTLPSWRREMAEASLARIRQRALSSEVQKRLGNSHTPDAELSELIAQIRSDGEHQATTQNDDAVTSSPTNDDESDDWRKIGLNVLLFLTAMVGFLNMTLLRPHKRQLYELACEQSFEMRHAAERPWVRAASLLGWLADRVVGTSTARMTMLLLTITAGPTLAIALLGFGWPPFLASWGYLSGVVLPLVATSGLFCLVTIQLCVWTVQGAAANELWRILIAVPVVVLVTAAALWCSVCLVSLGASVEAAFAMLDATYLSSHSDATSAILSGSDQALENLTNSMLSAAAMLIYVFVAPLMAILPAALYFLLSIVLFILSGLMAVTKGPYIWFLQRVTDIEPTAAEKEFDPGTLLVGMMAALTALWRVFFGG